nr:hypothetical protein [Rhizobium sp. P40RR-XXII]
MITNRAVEVSRNCQSGFSRHASSNKIDIETTFQLITFNEDSSSVKIGLCEVRHDTAIDIARAVIDFRRRPLTFHLPDGPACLNLPLKAAPGDELHMITEENV